MIDQAQGIRRILAYFFAPFRSLGLMTVNPTPKTVSNDCPPPDPLTVGAAVELTNVELRYRYGRAEPVILRVYARHYTTTAHTECSEAPITCEYLHPAAILA
jgi:hypothetical protein